MNHLGRRRIATVASVLLAITAQTVDGQKPVPTKPPTADQREIARLRAELDACRAATEKRAVGEGDEALRALRAVQSALSSGANIQEFKRYQIEAQIKVDQLPETVANAPIREIGQTYKDAVKLAMLSFDGTLSGSEKGALLKRYESPPEMAEAIQKLETTDDRGSVSAKLNGINGKYAAQILFLLAEERMAKLSHKPLPSAKE